MKIESLPARREAAASSVGAVASPRRFSASALVAAAILAAATVLRVWGLDYGLPFQLASDEEVMVGGALRMLELHTLVPALHSEPMSILYYPVVLPYLYAALALAYTAGAYVLHGFPALDLLPAYVLGGVGDIWYLARLSSALLGVGTVLIVYRLGAAMFRSPLAGLVAMALVGFDFFSTFLAHFARHWTATVFFIWATGWLAWKIYEAPLMRRYAGAGLLAALGFGTSYFGAFGIAFAGVAHLAALRRVSALFDRRLIVMALVFAVVSLLTVLLFPDPLLRLLRGSVVPIYRAKTLSGYLDCLAFYGSALWLADPVLVLLGGAGLLLALLRRAFVLAGGAVASILAYTAFQYWGLPLEDRYIMPVVPVLALLGGYAAHAVAARVGDWRLRVALGVGLALVLLFPAAVSSRATELLGREDTRLLARNWIERNLPAGSGIVVAINNVRLAPTVDAIAEQQAIDPASLKAVDRYALAHPDAATQKILFGDAPRFRALHLAQFAGLEKGAVGADLAAKLAEAGYSYYIADAYTVRYMPDLDAALRRSAEELVSFRPGESAYSPSNLRTTVLVEYPQHHLFEIDRFGPSVTIYKLRQPGSAIR